jgi:predicted glycosyltransferase
MRIWIDLANTPHVLFFEPVIRELERRGHAITLTARRFASTLPVAMACGLQPQVIGDGHDASRSEVLKRERHLRRTAATTVSAPWIAGPSGTRVSPSPPTPRPSWPIRISTPSFSPRQVSTHYATGEGGARPWQARCWSRSR